MKLNELTILEVLEGLKTKKFSSVEVTGDCLLQIKKLDGKLNAFVTVTEDFALSKAREADLVIHKEGENAFRTRPLLGVPYALKDNFCTKGIRTTASSKIIENFIPPYESTVSSKLNDAGAILLGKTNMDAFAHGSSTESSDFFTTKNPHDAERLPGGSSGGSAAAVGANMCIFGIGSETAGSVRQPAAWCGVVGFKPTYGRVSRYGLISMASSTDSPGPITKDVLDSAYLLKVIAGKDQQDATTSERKVPDYTGELKKLSRKLKVGVAKSYFPAGMERGVRDRIEEALSLIGSAGYEIVDVDLLDPKYSIAVYTILQRSEVSSNLARFDGIRFGFGREKFGFEAKKRIMTGTYTLSAGYYDKFYLRAQKVRTLIVEDFKRAFKKVDVIVAPISPSVALPLGATEGNAMFGELQDMLVEPSSIAGLTGISIPCGLSENLPVGLGIMAEQFEEAKVLSFANYVESLLKGKNESF